MEIGIGNMNSYICEKQMALCITKNLSIKTATREIKNKIKYSPGKDNGFICTSMEYKRKLAMLGKKFLGEFVDYIFFASL